MKKLLFIAPVLLFMGCKPSAQKESSMKFENKVNQFADFTLTSNIEDLSNKQREMLKLFFEAAKIMDKLFWEQAYGSKEKALKLSQDKSAQEFIKINYGPWERLNNDSSFITGIGPKPLGANFYPTDMTKGEFEAFEDENKKSLYTVIRKIDGKLTSVPYHVEYANELKQASELLLKASTLAEDEGFGKYLELRSKALLNGKYLESDLAWMDMKTNRIDFVVGPIENYEDKLFGYKTAFEAYILLKDLEWSKKLERFSALLPELQKRLPVDEKYRSETPGSNSDLGAYDVVYYAGDCNAGSKTIAINLPNDPEVHKQKGSRRLQLKNAMQAKFDKILLPISELLISKEQQQFIRFSAFFENTMYHEVAHGIGVHHTITDGLPVRKALKDKASALEEGKADILGLFLVDQLVEMGELDTDTRINYVTFTAGLFRSIRFGASSAHGVANLVRFNYFKEKGAFTRSKDGVYTIDFEKMKLAVDALANKILVIQGNGDYEAATQLVEKYGSIGANLQADLNRINAQNIPVDIKFSQGAEVLGL